MVECKLIQAVNGKSFNQPTVQLRPIPLERHYG
jgi:hypothetical protein